MLKNTRIILLSALAFSSAAYAADATTPTLNTYTQKMSYLMAYSMGKQLHMGQVAIDTDTFAAGLKAGLAGADPAMSKEDIQKTMAAYQKEMTEKRTALLNQVGTQNKTEGDTFRAKYATQTGVVKLDGDKLMYRIITEGHGAKPVLTDKVSMTYKGTLVDGKVFDASDKSIDFALVQMIPAMQKVLTQVPTGSTVEIVTGPSYAYGAQGAGPLIGPNASLMFVVTTAKK